MKRYVATFASQGSNLENRETCEGGGVHAPPPPTCRPSVLTLV